MQRPSPHSNFFSSLKQLEKRLKREAVETPTQSLISRLYLNCDETPADSITRSTNLKKSEGPLQFLSNSSLAQESVGIVEAGGNGVDEIELMMQLLGFRRVKGKDPKGWKWILAVMMHFMETLLGFRVQKVKKKWRGL